MREVAADSADTTPVRASELLHWYDRHARALPWRVAPGAPAKPDPYRVWLSEIMLQQTTVAAVKSYFERFTARWPTVAELAAAPDEDVLAAWAGLGYYARARNLLKCARKVVAEHGGQFPHTREGLMTLPGVGPYTSAAIAAIAFDQREAVVDGNVERVMARVFDVTTPLPAAKRSLTDLADRLTPDRRPGDYAQAVMDLGATVCTPRAPACGICPWMAGCAARRAGTAAARPIKAPRKVKPTRHGHVYLARIRGGDWLLEQRPARGLLGGMLGLPGSDWTDQAPAPAPPLPGDWQALPGEVRHTFTHFHLKLTVHVAHLPDDAVVQGLVAADRDRWRTHDAASFRAEDLPTVMRKAFRLAQPWFETNTAKNRR